MNEFFIGIGIFFLIGITAVGMIIGIIYIFSIPEVNIFNQQYGTHYTAWQWVCASDTIKDYIGVGEVKRINVEGLITQKGD